MSTCWTSFPAFLHQRQPKTDGLSGRTTRKAAKTSFYSSGGACCQKATIFSRRRLNAVSRAPACDWLTGALYLSPLVAAVGGSLQFDGNYLVMNGSSRASPPSGEGCCRFPAALSPQPAHDCDQKPLSAGEVAARSDDVADVEGAFAGTG